MKKEFLFYIFIFCLISCALLVLFLIWGNEQPNEILPKSAATFFVIGLGSFLTWFSLIFIEVAKSIANRR